jgi:hypothetical protein
MATKRQIKKAARLWSLALIAHTDGWSDDDDESAVRAIAVERAVLELHRKGYDPGDLQSERDCLDAVIAT